MKVLMITGDKNFKPGNERYDLQKSAVEELAVVYWGRGSMWPKIPAGQFDVVTAQDAFWRGLFSMRVAKRFRAKLNVQVHTDLSVYTGIKHILAKIVLRHADSIRVVSEKIKQQVGEIGVTAKIFVLPIYIDIQKFRTVTPEPHEKKTILWIGRFEDEKDPSLAIEIIKQIPDTKLIMLGKGSQEAVLRKQAAGLPVEFPGWQDPMQYLPTADMVLCTSKHESYGASIVESLAAGVPVVAPDVGIAKEAGANVVDKADLAEEIIRVLKSGQKRSLELNLLNKQEWAAAWKETLQ